MNDPMLFWAKLGSEVWPTKYHPVICHLIDVGQVARSLWEVVCHERIKEWVRKRLGLLDENTTGAWLAFWVAAHDIGKVSPCFQHRGPNTQELQALLLQAGFDFTSFERKHGDISTKVLAADLKQRNGWPAIPEAVARQIAVAVGGHHGAFPTDWDCMTGPLGNEKWHAAVGGCSRLWLICSE